MRRTSIRVDSHYLLSESKNWELAESVSSSYIRAPFRAVFRAVVLDAGRWSAAWTRTAPSRSVFRGFEVFGGALLPDERGRADAVLVRLLNPDGTPSADQRAYVVPSKDFRATWEAGYATLSARIAERQARIAEAEAIRLRTEETQADLRRRIEAQGINADSLSVPTPRPRRAARAEIDADTLTLLLDRIEDLQ